jgi:hypothetical protein
VAWFAIEEPEKGHRYAHTSENTLRVYVQSIDGLKRGGRNAGARRMICENSEMVEYMGELLGMTIGEHS